ncbi:MAG: alpha/beta hydrolase [Steroidobacteraceae bacterium]
MAYLTTESGQRIYFEHHRGSKLPVLLIHGWGMSCRIWDTTLSSLLAAGHEVVTFDQRGCGNSDKDFPANTIGLGAGDALAVLREAAIERAVVNGWSLGGAIATETAHRLGSKCAGLVLTAAATPRYVQAPDYPFGNPPGGPVATVEALRADRANFFDGLTKAVCAVEQSAAMNNWLWSIFMQTAPCADDALAELDTLDQRKILAALDVPILSFIGTKDVFVPPDVGRSVAAIARRLRTIEYEGCGHAPFIEAAQRYRADLLGFLASLN